MGEGSPTRYIDTKSASKILGVCTDTLKKYRKDGMPFLAISRKTFRYLESDIVAWMKRRHEEQTNG